jgi:farnesyl-diphosphate farnesyltransferase
MISRTEPLLTDLLPSVSRSFYLTLRALPSSIRPQIGLAYLLARATDTIADTAIVPVPQRLEALAGLRQRILGERGEPLNISQFTRAEPSRNPGAVADGTSAERQLLERIEEAIALLERLSGEDRQRIRDVLTTITGGQELDLKRFGNATAANIVSLATPSELDDYTYRVAGCVGEFWTKMCRAHVFPLAALEDATLLDDGVRFGKGLQLVNILRDLPRDLRQGRCYLPLDQVTALGLTPADLLDARSEGTLRSVYNHWLDIADSHLAAGWRYTNALPRSALRVRLACAWPVLIGVKTLARLRAENPLDAARRVKVSRAEVKRLIVATVVRYPFAHSWMRLFERARL